MITIPDGMRRPAEVEHEELRKQLAEARADLRLAKNIIETHVERVAERDKLIEQMCEVLRGVCEKCPCDTRLEDARCKDCDVGAAISAAERGE